MENNIQHLCSICFNLVSISNLHPESLEMPKDDSPFSVLHKSCADREDRDFIIKDGDTDDLRAWIILR